MQRNIAIYWCKIIAVHKTKFTSINHAEQLSLRSAWVILPINLFMATEIQSSLNTAFNRKSLDLTNPLAPGHVDLTTKLKWLVFSSPAVILVIPVELGYPAGFWASETWICVWISFLLLAEVTSFHKGKFCVLNDTSCNEFTGGRKTPVPTWPMEESGLLVTVPAVTRVVLSLSTSLWWASQNFREFSLCYDWMPDVQTSVQWIPTQSCTPSAFTRRPPRHGSPPPP